MSINLPVSIASHQTAAVVRNEGNVKSSRARRFVESINGAQIKADVFTIAGENVVRGLDLTVKATNGELDAAIATAKAAGLTVTGTPSVATVSDEEIRAAAAAKGYNSVLIFSGTAV